MGGKGNGEIKVYLYQTFYLTTLYFALGLLLLRF